MEGEVSGTVKMLLAETGRHMRMTISVTNLPLLDVSNLLGGELAGLQVLPIRLDQDLEAILLILQFQQLDWGYAALRNAVEAFAFLLGDFQLARAFEELHLAGLKRITGDLQAEEFVADLDRFAGDCCVDVA